MLAHIRTLAILCFLTLAAFKPSAAADSGVVVNGVPIDIEQVHALQQALGVPPSAPIRPGRYWYDQVSGLWGMEGGPALGQIFAGLPLGGRLQSDASQGRTGVFINSRQITTQEAAYLQSLFGVVLPGRYWLDWRGIGGFEGGPPLFDLGAAARSGRGGRGQYGGYTRRTPFGGLGGDGNCSYYLHPEGPSVMNCD